jgi:hypothetical protein
LAPVGGVVYGIVTSILVAGLILLPPTVASTERRNRSLMRTFETDPPTSPRGVRLLAALAAAILVLFAALVVGPAASEAAPSGQLEAWNVEYGTEPGQFFNPKQVGVDPVDGSVYILSFRHGFSEADLQKFSPTGDFEGGVPIPRHFVGVEEEFRTGLVGIAVDHATGHVYLVEQEYGINTVATEEPTATNILVFSTQPQNKELVPATPAKIALPDPTGANAILGVNEIHVDPSNGQIVLSGRNTAGQAILQRLDATGALKGTYTETGDDLHGLPDSFPAEMNFGFAVGSDGTTYLVAKEGVAEEREILAFELPPNFKNGTTPATSLTPLPGFAAAGATEGWKDSTFGFLIEPPNLIGQGNGPQVALGKAPDGEETLYWKTGVGQSEPYPVTIHGWSLQQQATTVAWGDGAAEGECVIDSRNSSLAATPGGDLLVLESGQEVSEESSSPSFGPGVFVFGPGGSGCPGPAAGLAVDTPAGAPTTSVVAGTRVTLDASVTPVVPNPEAPGQTLPVEKVTWIVKAPNGTESEVSTAGTPAAEKLASYFTEVGDYTVREKMQFERRGYLGEVGNVFAAKPMKVTVTPATGTAPTVTAVSPDHAPATGGNTVTIEGTGLEAATAVQFGLVNATITEDTATQIKATVPPGTPAEKVGVFVTTANGTSVPSPAAEYEYEPLPTVTLLEPSHGTVAGGTSVTITGTGLEPASAVHFGLATATITEDTPTKIKATAPAGIVGKVPVTVTTPAGTSLVGPEFTYDPTLTIALTGTGTGAVSCNGAACQPSYPAGTVLTLAATATSGSSFSGWGGSCSGAAGCVLKLEAPASVTATFTVVPPVVQPPAPVPPAPVPPAPTPTPKPKPTPTKTKAQKLKEERAKALKKCTKLKGKAKVMCVKKAQAIGKPKPKPKSKAHK